MSYEPGWCSPIGGLVPFGTLGHEELGLQSFAAWFRNAASVHMWAKSLFVLKALVLFYWVWAAYVLVRGDASGFDAIIAFSAPMFVSFHFLQALLVLRRIKSEQPFWLQLAQTLAFGALYLAPLLLAQHSAPRPTASKSGRT